MTERSLNELFEAVRETVARLLHGTGPVEPIPPTRAPEDRVQNVDDAMAAVDAAEAGTRRALEALRREIAILTARCNGLTELLEQGPQGHIVTDPEGRILSANERAWAMLGLMECSAVGHPITEFLRDPSAAKAVDASRAAVSGRLQGPITLFPTSRKDPFGAVIVAAPEPAGAPTLQWLLHDLGDRALLTAEVADYLRESQRLELVGRLAGGIAHDFNNLLMIINGQVQFVLDALDEHSPIRTDIEEIRDAGLRAADLTSQLLAYSRRSGRQLRILDLNDVLEGMARMLRRLIGEDVCLELNLDHLPAPVRADQGQIEQIVMNLAINARDAMPTGGTLCLGTERVTVDEDQAVELDVDPGEYVALRVRDSGHGMSPEVQSRLFEPFFTTKTRGRGTGLGLVLVRGLITQFGGAITISSEVGVGSTFTVYLPLEVGARRGGLDVPLQPEHLPGGEETVLVVEDDPLVRRMTVRMLGRLGYTVLEASDAQSARDILDRSLVVPDLLLTDVIMPGESGRDLAQQLRSRFIGLRVLYMSGYPREKLGAHGVLDPGIRILQKPFTIRGLAVRLREVLDEPRALEAGGHNQQGH